MLFRWDNYYNQIIKLYSHFCPTHIFHLLSTINKSRIRDQIIILNLMGTPPYIIDKDTKPTKKGGMPP